MRKTAKVNGIEMSYAVWGEGSKNLVILPGVAVRDVSKNEAGVAEMFKDFTGYTLHLPDRRSNISSGYSIEDMAEDTAAVLKSLGIEKTDIYATSQGAMMAQYIAANHPEMVDRMVLVSSLAVINPEFKKVYDNWAYLAENRRVKELAENIADTVYSEKTLKLFRGQIVQSGLECTDEELDRYAILCHALDTMDARDRLSEIRCPVLVMGAEGDKVTQPEGSYQLSSLLKCEFYMFGREYGHAVYDEAPEVLTRALEFFRRETEK